MDPEEVRAQLRKWAIIGTFFVLAFALYLFNRPGLLVAYAVVVGVLAVLAILIQAGRGGGLAASLGGVGADSLLGTHSASPIARATYVMLGLFFFISILAARMSVNQREEGGFVPQGRPAPNAPAPMPGGSGAPVAPSSNEGGAPPAGAQPESPPAESPAND
jgi:protein translocase SecG subunit